MSLVDGRQKDVASRHISRCAITIDGHDGASRHRNITSDRERSVGDQSLENLRPIGGQGTLRHRVEHLLFFLIVLLDQHQEGVPEVEELAVGDDEF